MPTKSFLLLHLVDLVLCEDDVVIGIEQDGLKEVPNTRVTPVLGKDVSWVARTSHVDESDKAGGNDGSVLVE